MGEQQNEKMDQLFSKLKSLGERAKQARSSLGSPIADRLLDRVTKISAKLPTNNNGHAQQAQAQQAQQPQPEVRRTCPKCGRSFNENVDFCNCGFSFQEEARQRAREGFEREKLERSGRMGVITGG